MVARQDEAAGTSLDPLAGGGEVGALLRGTDWARTPLGPISGWPRSLTVPLQILLSSRYAMWMGWGPELTMFYNDAYRHMTLGVKHPWALGRSAREVWAEIWSDIGPRAESVLQTGVATWDEGLRLFLQRSGFPEETYHTFSYSPLATDDGRIGGMLCVVTEDTERIIGERRLSLLHELASDLAPANTEQEVGAAILGRLGATQRDLAFTLTYQFDGGGREARLVAASVLEPGSPAAPMSLPLDGDGQGNGHAWPAAEILAGEDLITVDDLASRFAGLPGVIWDRPPTRAAVVAIAKQGQESPAGFLVAGLNPYRSFDAAYRSFVTLLAGQIGAGLANARAWAEERRRAEALAELDRAKSTFFSNVSHEFRTPLTLMLGPIEDLLEHESGGLPSGAAEQLSVAHRNGKRLLKLVGNLLDFSRIEAGRVQARFEATDLAAFTTDVASVFRSAVERAGMRLTIECEPLAEPVQVDRDMWEKIVLNLLSNAFKYTLAGEIAVTLRAVGAGVELAVRDTGTGIPEAELPKIFNRFHRVEGARGRTHEGTGIGLALVQELVKIHGGQVGATSRLGRGSMFTVTLPRGDAQVPADASPAQAHPDRARAAGASAFVEEALRWLPAQEGKPLLPDVGELPQERAGPGERPRVLVADDNADMRDYIRRLLAPRCEVVTVGDGAEALAAFREQRFDLVLSDVMMPQVDGFALLAALRKDPRTATVPVIMLSARAGEEARVEGLGAGADDYLIKPFSARELIARVSGTLALAAARRDALHREAELRAETASVLETMAEGFVALDRELRVTYMNAEAERLYGRDRGAVIGRDFLEAFPDLAGPPVEAALHRAVAERTPHRLETRPEPGKPTFELSVYPGKEGASSVYLRDVTERRRRTEQLQALAAASAAVGSVLSVDEALRALCDRAREVIGADQAIAYLVVDGRPSPTAVARSFSPRLEAWHDFGGVPALGAFQRRVIEENQPLRLSRGELEPGAAGPPGRGWLAAPLQGHDGKNLGIVVLSDPTGDDFSAGDEAILAQLARTASAAIANARLYRATQEARAEAERASNTKDQFLATLSHELRTPLNAILGWSRLVQSGRLDAATLRDGLATIERNSRIQAQLIEDLLDISRIVSGKLRLDVQRIDLGQVIDAALAAIRPAAQAREIRIQSVLDPLAGSLNGDPARLQQVVWNLLSNAVKFTPRGGRIQVLLERAGSHVELSVADTGQGISAEFLPHVFERFRQADASTTRRHGGLGLGLSIVRQLVEMHGGTVRAKSPGEGQGSTFTVALPITAVLRPESAAGPGEARSPERELAAMRPSRLGGVRVLVVDDEPDARELIRYILSEREAEVVAVGSVPEALAALDTFRPNVLISDVGMPEQDGYGLIRAVREHGHAARDVPAIALTAFARPEDRRRALLSGFQVHVPKPVEPEELVAVVASLLGRTEVD